MVRITIAIESNKGKKEEGIQECREKTKGKLRKQRKEEDALEMKANLETKGVAKKYARSDELGVPFGITVARSVMTMERDSKDQIRVNVKDAVIIVKEVTEGLLMLEKFFKAHKTIVSPPPNSLSFWDGLVN
ncbi:hypothetical protein L484_010878 [Morus notabilis]|uniref:Anticodon-binding domain-containing protein n=1 Tax=Morus notabilis TaxID=981085 RepID=W9QZ14_9ROSA|nr:hypothetical protein L484_010878 [Morus notabilis]